MMDEQDIFAAITKDKAVLTRLVRAAHRMRHDYGHLWEPQEGCGCEEWIDRLLHEYDDEDRVEATPEDDDTPWHLAIDTTPLHLICAICGRTRDFSDHDHPSMGHGFIPAGKQR